jgi:hypothetical protein
VMVMAIVKRELDDAKSYLSMILSSLINND